MVIFFRTLILYLVVIITMRVMGKRQIGQLQPFELAIAIMISELAAVPMQNTGIPLINGIIPILTLLVAQLAISLIALRSTRGRGVICGQPRILIEKGRIIEENLRKEMYTLNDLLEQLRIKDEPNILDIEYAILETNGQLSIIPKSQKRPVTPEDLKVATPYEGLPLEFIIDGKVIRKNLIKAKKDDRWLEEQLRIHKIAHTSDVLFASIDTQNNIYMQKKIHAKG